VAQAHDRFPLELKWQGSGRLGAKSRKARAYNIRLSVLLHLLFVCGQAPPDDRTITTIIQAKSGCGLCRPTTAPRHSNCQFKGKK
jgi:hypothetical protein